MTVGWWLHNRGSTDPSFANTLGWDRTHLALIPSIQLEAGYNVGKVCIGLGGAYQWLMDDDMIRSQDAIGRPNRFKVAENWVELGNLHGFFEYKLIHNQKFALGPHIKAGTFWIKTTHPERAGFGRKLYTSIGITHQIRLTHFMEAIIRPEYLVFYMWPKQGHGNLNEQHRIYGLGIGLGLRFHLP